MHRLYWQNTRSKWFTHFLNLFYSRLQARGHTDADLQPLFVKAALKRVEQSEILELKTAQANADALRDTVFLHAPFHPQNPPRKAIQLAFQHHLQPPVLERHVDPALQQLTIAYSRAPNIANTVRINHLAPSADTTL
jgi:hypothetical protein